MFAIPIIVPKIESVIFNMWIPNTMNKIESPNPFKIRKSFSIFSIFVSFIEMYVQGDSLQLYKSHGLHYVVC